MGFGEPNMNDNLVTIEFYGGERDGEITSGQTDMFIEMDIRIEDSTIYLIDESDDSHYVVMKYSRDAFVAVFCG